MMPPTYTGSPVLPSRGRPRARREPVDVFPRWICQYLPGDNVALNHRPLVREFAPSPHDRWPKLGDLLALVLFHRFRSPPLSPAQRAERLPPETQSGAAATVATPGARTK